MATTEEGAVKYLRTLEAVRERCYEIFEEGKKGALNNFEIDFSKVDSVAEYVLEVLKESYPSLDVPFHSRWRHFEVGSVPRKQKLESLWENIDQTEKTRRLLDLVVVSVLLDAGAGPTWKYREVFDGKEAFFNRSEGLAVASWHLFVDGAFSSDPNNKYQVDAQGLQQLTLDRLRSGMQVTEENALVGLEGRLQLLQRLGAALQAQPNYFSIASSSSSRIGYVLDHLVKEKGTTSLPIEYLWYVVIDSLQNIWPPTRTALAGKNLGDVWEHRSLASKHPNLPGGNLVPFHKLSQWLTYSLLEPLQEFGFSITGLKAMTGLPEYRNGGLLIDMGVLVPKRPEILKEKHEVFSEVVIEWRALTVVLLDLVGERVRALLGKNEVEFPLVKVLEGGTWKAGRLTARRLRPADGGPPLQVISDGTVF
eukprot:TRINITY_DN13776_c0_g1_i1.p1 TRINITY_DN13776_c0_g1~~TRINITY_DN13776_c0_g1_i1.p1  ORF type:complete len:422 (-),score=132.32 TRINITY_DN13776_c0_g1_i1:70-1335(-)